MAVSNQDWAVQVVIFVNPLGRRWVIDEWCLMIESSSNNGRVINGNGLIEIIILERKT
jgi:hypothetical protein